MSRSIFLAARGTPSTRSATKNRQTIFQNFNPNTLFFGGNNVNTFITPTSITPLNTIGITGSFSCGALVNLFPKFSWSTDNNTDNHAICTAGFNYPSILGYTFQVTTDGGLLLVAGQNFYTSSLGLVPFGTWVWIIYILNGTTITGYINGIKVWQQTSITRVASSSLSSDLNYFGTENASSGAGQRRIKGYLSMSFSMSSPLTQAQVNDIVFANKFPSVDILYYCNEGTGNTVYDKSGNTNNGALGTGVWLSSAPAIGAKIRTNLIINPSFESASFWSYGTSGSITGLTYVLHDTTYVLSGTYAATYQANFTAGARNGQYYLSHGSIFNPVMGHIYTFSAYIYIPTGSPLQTVNITIRDYITYNIIGSKVASLVPGQWTRISTTATATAVYPEWRFIIADPTANGYTGNASWWVDNTMVEDTDILGSYFDGSSTNASWTGTANQSTSQLLSDRMSTT